MPKKPKARKMKTFRIETGIDSRLKKVAEKMGIPESWFINKSLENQMPEFERMAERAEAQAA